MAKAKRFLLLAACLLTAASATAGGAGGILYGMQYFDAAYSNADLGTCMAGGYGYGTSLDGQRVGGFGMALFPAKGSPGIAGGVGGMLTGQEARLGSLTIALDILMGVGGIGADMPPGTGHWGGAMVAFGELDLSVGFTLVRWMQIVAYAGFHGIGNLFPGVPFQTIAYYSPAIGVRIAWGSF
jgi:hypothetical protein